MRYQVQRRRPSWPPDRWEPVHSWRSRSDAEVQASAIRHSRRHRRARWETRVVLDRDDVVALLGPAINEDRVPPPPGHDLGVSLPDGLWWWPAGSWALRDDGTAYRLVIPGLQVPLSHVVGRPETGGPEFTDHLGNAL